MDIVLNQNVTINDPDLKAVTTEIRKAGANVIGNTFKIAALIARVEDNELYVNDGFLMFSTTLNNVLGWKNPARTILLKWGVNLSPKSKAEKPQNLKLY